MQDKVNSDYLPPSQRVPLNVLVSVFKNTQNSYKYLLLLSILRNLKSNLYSGSRVFSLEELQAEMLTIAWYPHNFFKLSFGTQDKVSRMLDDLPEPKIKLKSDTVYHIIELKNHIKKNMKDLSLMRYVPYRLIRSFFSKETKGLQDSKVNKKVSYLAQEKFDEIKPLYYVDDSEKVLIIHTDWLHYLYSNISIVEEWALWEWLQYMQLKNPNTTNLSAKLLPPEERKPLKKQREFWKKAISSSTIQCPYSGIELKHESFALDHFLPWSFVVHDRIWNLVPTSHEINSKKSDQLPNICYLNKVIENHFNAIHTTKYIFGKRKWRNYIEEYITDLKMDEKTLQNKNDFSEKYSQQVTTMLFLAKAQGFTTDWKWN